LCFQVKTDPRAKKLGKNLLSSSNPNILGNFETTMRTQNT